MQQQFMRNADDLAAENAALRERIALLEAELAASREVSTFHATARQRELELALGESEARFATAFHVSPVAMVISTVAEGRVLDANMRFLKLFGYEREQIVGQASTALGMWADPDDRLRALKLLQRDGYVRDWEVVIRGADDRQRYALLSVERIQLTATPCLLTALYDITDRVCTEAALQQSEALYHAIAHSLPDAAVFVVDPEGRYLLAEGPGLMLMGLSQDELQGRTPHEVFDPATATQTTTYFQQALAGEEVILEYTYAERIWWKHYTPLRNDDGQIWAAISLALDITARKRLEQQLLQAQKMESIGQMAGGIAHDFNNLLTAIGGYSELVLAELPPDAPARADLTEIQKATDRAAALTRQLLAFSRRQHLETRPTNLNELVADLENLLRRLIGEHIQLVILPASDLGLVVVDPGQIEQVLVNLVLNARDAMPEGGLLTITTANVELEGQSAHGHGDLPAGPYVLLTVSDTGVGIAPELQAHVFEPFFSTKLPGKGSGLGLATCYGIVTQHGGAIWLYSELDYGTTVKIYLPRDDAATLSPRQPIVATALPRGHETVLLAEDEPAVRAMAVRVLAACGYNLLAATDGADAVRVAAAHLPLPIHLLLTDVVMPHMSGPAAAEQLRAWYPELRILYMSGYTGMAGARHTLTTHTEPLIQKPFSPSELAVAVRTTLDHTR
jgi:two-component system, cell cycle sensor histidine kinase and response regulator CckA